MTKFSFKSIASTVIDFTEGYRRQPLSSLLTACLLASILAPQSASAQGSSTTPKRTTTVPQESPLFSLSGSLYEANPQSTGQTTEKKPLTVGALSIGLNLPGWERRENSMSLELAGTYSQNSYTASSNPGLTSAELYLMQTYAVEDSDTQISYGLKAAGPANEIDREAGFKNAFGASFGLAFSLLGTKISLAAEPMTYNYEWDTADQLGTSYNTKTSIVYLVRFSTPLGKSLKWRNSASDFQYQNFAGNTYHQASLSSNLAWQFTKGFNLNGGIATTERVDKITTTQRAFSRDVLNYRIGMEWSI